jgi:hypothetical protein
VSPVTKAFFYSSDNDYKLTFKLRISFASFLLSLSAYLKDEESTIPSLFVTSFSESNLFANSSIELVKLFGAFPCPHKSFN